MCGQAQANVAWCYHRNVTIPRKVGGVFSAERRLHAIRGLVDIFPRGLRQLTRKVLRFSAARLGDIVDAAQFVTGRRDPLLPPRRMIFVGSNSIIKADYHVIGRELVDLAVRMAGLRPESSVLEVGSGTGRIASTLTTILSSEGRFEGFEIVPAGVQWCQTRITPRFPRFHFTHADVFNAVYNPAGRENAATYQFPYESGSFDIVMATSVLTHMFRVDAAHYLSEAARVLRPGGRTFITHFLSTPLSRAAVTEGRSAMRFLFPVPDGLTIDAAAPEDAIAIDLDAVTSDYQQAGLIIDAVHVGRWTGNLDGAHFQDIIVARKA